MIALPQIEEAERPSGVKYAEIRQADAGYIYFVFSMAGTEDSQGELALLRPSAVSAQSTPFLTQADYRIVPSQRLDDIDFTTQFSLLARQWKEETADFSILTRRYKHPSYRAILDMGAAAIPLILAELSRSPDRWFDALERATNQNPAKGAKTFYEAVDCWLSWGADEGHLA